jgi:beta-N-acetylhexosaminidase
MAGSADAPPLVAIDLQGPDLTPDERAALASEPISGVCLFARNLRDRHQARELSDELRATSGRELLVTIDQEGGGVIRLHDVPSPPSAMALGAVDDAQLTEAIAAATARGLQVAGVNVDLAPVADVQSNPENPVIADRAFGADPALVARHVTATVRGLQRAGVAATLKHFPGHGDTDVDSHLALPRLPVDEERLRALEWVPFAAGIAAGVAAVMTAHVMVPALDPELPATLSPTVIDGALRRQLGFDGVVFTDALNMRAIRDRWPAPRSAVLALAAGVDVPLSCGTTNEHLAVLRAVADAVRDGRLDPARLRASTRRIERLLAAYPVQDGSRARSALADHEAGDAGLVRSAARRAVVALGAPPRLEPGRPVVLLGEREVAAGAATDTRERPIAALAAALERAGVPVRWPSAETPPPASLLAGAQALVVVTSRRTPMGDAELEPARSALRAATEAGLPTLHLALWNPAHVRGLPGPALVTFGFRPASIEAAVHALLSGEAPGTPPLPLPTREGDA